MRHQLMNHQNRCRFKIIEKKRREKAKKKIIKKGKFTLTKLSQTYGRLLVGDGPEIALYLKMIV